MVRVAVDGTLWHLALSFSNNRNMEDCTVELLTSGVVTVHTRGRDKRLESEISAALSHTHKKAMSVWARLSESRWGSGRWDETLFTVTFTPILPRITVTLFK